MRLRVQLPADLLQQLALQLVQLRYPEPGGAEPVVRRLALHRAGAARQHRIPHGLELPAAVHRRLQRGLVAAVLPVLRAAQLLLRHHAADQPEIGDAEAADGQHAGHQAAAAAGELLLAVHRRPLQQQRLRFGRLGIEQRDDARQLLDHVRIAVELRSGRDMAGVDVAPQLVQLILRRHAMGEIGAQAVGLVVLRLGAQPLQHLVRRRARLHQLRGQRLVAAQVAVPQPALYLQLLDQLADHLDIGAEHLVAVQLLQQLTLVPGVAYCHAGQRQHQRRDQQHQFVGNRETNPHIRHPPRAGTLPTIGEAGS
ncbi:hypothetical protein CV_1676 [Chromobacterium violaceum ATCC 12472]|uniref:Uncharacterized protein n=1 Tax=Chromobacterium violaceum (strain ATCC 12472 / DSM 30191 / JCM 1249 / CCUG 213 / NBRC 12614 / NCIMB 9131 / NCTC 9757 / MK) TaxID=243365 RepID=Q7NPS7_CHRVO|nr:hypothetical protein CV_1676 [Chromobacterium violaceum ATCC 12472]